MARTHDMGGRPTEEPLNLHEHALADWEVVEEVVRIGNRVRLILAPGAPDAAGVAAWLRTRVVEGGATAAEVEPSVEDLFVSFVDRERKQRVREQLHAISDRT